MSSSDGNGADEVTEGSLIQKRYRLVTRLAKGGMGTVYRGTDTALNRDVAIKLLHPSKDPDDPEQLVERFRREAEALARLNHRNIVTIFDYGPTREGGYFLVMEYVDGGSIADLVKREEIEPQRAIQLMMQIARALRYAHNNGIVHRDIKMGNILLRTGDDGEIAKLVDFGLVQLEKDESLTAHGMIIGSTHCMAPEQIKGEEVDARTDIYALGCVLFRLLTGRYPYNSDRATEVIAAHLHAPIPRFLEVKPELVVPPGLEGIVRKCLAKDPADRYQDAGTLMHDLRECTEVPPSEFVSVTIIDESGALLDPPSKRWRAAALAALLVLLVGGFAFYGLKDPEAPPAPAGLDAAVVDGVEPSEPPPSLAGAEPDEPEPEPEPEPQQEPEPEAEPEPEEAPEPEVQPAPPPEPVRPPPRPEPRPVQPQPPPPPEPVEENDDALAATEEPPPAPSYAVVLQDLGVESTEERVTVTLSMSTDAVRPLKFAAERSDAEFPKQYLVTFRGGGAELGRSVVPVGGTLVDSVAIVQARGNLQVVIRSPGTPRMWMEGDGPEYRVIVER